MPQHPPPDPAWVALSLCRHLGGKTFHALLAHFDHDLHAILRAPAPELKRVRGVGPKIAQGIQMIDLSATHKAMQRWQAAGVRFITYTDPAYPPHLRRLEDAPPTLFVRGQRWLSPPQAAYAVVGTRYPSTSAQDAAQRFGMALAEAGHAVVSGLALGVDAAAQMGALAVPDGVTFSVLGGGILKVYPAHHEALAKAIIQRGALICEVSPEMTVNAPGLVARNRIITGLCAGLIVVETAADGGAMHAARFAKAQGTPVYVLENASTGNQQLLAEGAQAITPKLEGFKSLSS